MWAKASSAYLSDQFQSIYSESFYWNFVSFPKNSENSENFSTSTCWNGIFIAFAWKTRNKNIYLNIWENERYSSTNWQIGSKDWISEFQQKLKKLKNTQKGPFMYKLYEAQKSSETQKNPKNCVESCACKYYIIFFCF